MKFSKQMMIAAIILLIFACANTKPNYNLIQGSWNSTDVTNQSSKKISEQTTFYDGDSALMVIKIDGNETERYSLKYSVNRKDGKLNIERSPTLVNQFRIELINEKELHLLDLKTGNRKQYIRK